MSKRYLIVSTLAAAAAAVTLSACSSSGTSPAHSSTSGNMSMSGMTSGSTTVQAGAPATGPHNSADVSFATDMIPHHRQAVQMADMALSTATNAQVKSLAATIKGDQDPEIAKMSGWLTGWGMPLPSASMGSMGRMSMPGMMSDADMTRLGKASGAAFDRLWVQMMITHHQGALSMAKTELTSGQNAAAKALARSIMTSQSAQITQLTKLLTQLPSS